MQGTLDDTNRPIACYGWRRPDRRIVAAMLEPRISELPANSIRRQAIELMIEKAGLTSSPPQVA